MRYKFTPLSDDLGTFMMPVLGGKFVCATSDVDVDNIRSNATTLATELWPMNGNGKFIIAAGRVCMRTIS